MITNDFHLENMYLSTKKTEVDLKRTLQNFSLQSSSDLFNGISSCNTSIEYLKIDDLTYPKFTNEFWTAKQRQASSLHEIAYRACFKGQLPRFFIELLTNPGDTVYDPFSGRGTTVIEAALLGRNVIANDINPLSEILSRPRLSIPEIPAVQKHLAQIEFSENAEADIDLSMFYHPATLSEIVSLRNYLQERRLTGSEDDPDRWIRMVATNRLTGHSAGFFSVYSLPPNQAVTQESQRKINLKRNQKPAYRDTKKLILKKSKSLLRNLSSVQKENLKNAAKSALFLAEDARKTSRIPNDSVQLTVTSPPFLNIVQYAGDNWLRCWFNGIHPDEVAGRITMSRTVDRWSKVMGDVFNELFRLTKHNGWVAFEVGEVRKGKVKLEEKVIPLGTAAGFACEAILINRQQFTKTSNIWGIKNNERGTNSNRIVIFRKT